PFEVKYHLKEHFNQVSGSRKRGTNQIRREEDSEEENAMHHEGSVTQSIPTIGKVKVITFVRSVNVSDVIKYPRTLCNLFIELVKFFGVTNGLHLVTDNTANDEVADGMLNEKFPSIY
ncbi:hypothetical protein Lal_00031939, partial [Lupinus albus]